MISVSNSICEAKLLKPGNAGTEKKTKEKNSFSFLGAADNGSPKKKFQKKKKKKVFLVK
jgi:hypothetical protein